MDRTPGGQSLEMVTAIGSGLVLEGDGWREALAPLETVVVPAAIARYRLLTDGKSRALVASVPADDARS